MYNQTMSALPENNTASAIAPESGIVQGFAPVARADARLLILGSMPGVISLQQQQYYAHPYNAFWWIMEQLFAIDRRLDYATRLEQLSVHQIALWDVVYRCRRDGSLDSNIAAQSVVANDFSSLFRHCPHIQRIYFNGQKAAALWRKHVARALKPDHELILQTLPSTSPAHASSSAAQQLVAWQIITTNFVE